MTHLQKTPLNNRITTKKSTVSWLLLMILTVISTYIGLFVESKSLFITSVLFIVFLKGQQIIDIFMELRQAPTRWRFLFLSYVILVPLIIACIYLL
ncbi:MAG: cytochrome C oxidase subunit IV family protein [Colwellia sp.]